MTPVPELSGATLREVLARVHAAGLEAARRGLGEAADEVLRQARTNASNGSHAWGTPTPARPGSGPARISGTLVNSLTRTEVTLAAAGWETKVGLAPDKFPPYSSRTPSSRYGYYLETGLRNGARYPFLEPAAEHAGARLAAAIIKAFAEAI